MKFNIMACVALCLAIQACSGGSAKDNTADLAEIPVMKIQPQDTSLFTDYVADIQSVQHVELRSRMHGFIEKVLVDEGQEVRKGQLLFQLNDKEYNIALNKAKANLASAISAARIAEVELERIRTLVEKKVISPSELSLGEARKAEAEASIKTARSVIEDANQKLTYARVRAPFSGRIDRLPLKQGSLVEEGSLLTTLSDSRRMYAYFDVSENEYLQFVRKGKGRFDVDKEASLMLSDGSQYPLKGKIQTHENAFAENTGSIAFRAIFENPNHILKHGVSGKVRLVSALKGSLLIPQQAVFEIQDKSYVFVLGNHNRVKMRSFVPKLSLSGFYVVGSGLKAGEVIVYQGVQELRDGTTIKPVYTSFKKLLASK